MKEELVLLHKWLEQHKVVLSLASSKCDRRIDHHSTLSAIVSNDRKLRICELCEEVLMTLTVPLGSGTGCGELSLKPLLKIAPPLDTAELLLSVLRVIVTVPILSLSIAPPVFASLPVRMQSVTATVPEPV